MSTKKAILMYGLSSVFLFIFQFIYHKFGHGVISASLQFIWILPLICGSFLMILNRPLHTLSNRFAFNLYNMGIASIVNGFVLKGILDIAGSDSPYLIYFYIVGLLLFIISIVSFIIKRFSHQMV